MAKPSYPLHPVTKLFLVVLALTLGLWVLRAMTWLAFLPGLVWWVLILVCFSLAIVSSLQRLR
ncbi:MAG: hypothetical protein KGQ93_08880 [Cyanobacteria bacterium REEB459]|nr:hypothetical protein [Cyanobacteria bacterium REEB459]